VLIVGRVSAEKATMSTPRQVFTAFKETLLFDWTSEPIDPYAPLPAKRVKRPFQRRRRPMGRTGGHLIVASLVFSVVVTGLVIASRAAECGSGQRYPILEHTRIWMARLASPLIIWRCELK
jgi:hypothetical protein